jgi:hypothetical protein
MIHTTIPEQITTIEDTIIGNKTALQLGLLLGPVVIGFCMAIFLPPNYSWADYKTITTVLLLVIGAILQRRVRDKLVLQWLILYMNYRTRPNTYVYNKNDMFARPVAAKEPVQKTLPETSQQTVHHLPRVDLADVIKVEQAISNPLAKMRVEIGKKGTHVVITEIK